MAPLLLLLLGLALSAAATTPKYFHEPGGTLARSHYDSRFFKDEVPYDEHRVVLRSLVRSYLGVMRARGAETWIAHGTLLGWWWNGKIMPWDYDLDVQVTNTTMSWLAHNLNGTMHAYSPLDGAAQRTYLLDVNPHHVDVTRGDGANIIDARWIDIQNGMFIDITALREREPGKPGVWSCKNSHRYPTNDLWPMRATEFEDVPALVPHSFEKILTTEYGDECLTAEEFERHRWDRDIQEWVRESDDDSRKDRETAIQRKKEELQKQGRL